MTAAFLAPDEQVGELTQAQFHQIIEQIERRAWMVLRLSTYALRILLIGHDKLPPNLALDEAQLRTTIRSVLAKGQATNALSENIAQRLTADHLERSAPQWADVVPAQPQARLVIAALLHEKYRLNYAAIPQIRQALGLDEQATAFESRYGASPSAFLNASLQDLSVMSVGTMFVLEESRKRLEWCSVRRGEALFHEGDLGDSLYILVSGRMAVRQQVDQDAKTLAQLSQGAVIGEMALISQEARSATLVALRDSVLMRLSLESFNLLSKLFPDLIRSLTLQIIQRLRHASSPRQHPAPIIRTIAVVGLNTDVGPLCQALSAELARSGPALHLSSATLDQQAFPGALASLEGPQRLLVSTWLNEQEAGHRFIIYQADLTLSAWTRQAFQQADQVLLVADSQGAPTRYPLEDALNDMTERVSLVLLHPSAQHTIRGTADWLAQRRVDRHHHVALDKPDSVARLARFLAGNSIGVVCGGGGARGFAHLGVFRALNEQKIPIDFISGTSAGSILAGFVALERSPEEGLEQGLKLFTNFVDYTLPLLSLASGRRLTEGLKKLYGMEQRIEDLWIPFFCISTNVSRASQEIHSSGLMWRAVRASLSIPAVFPPVIHDNPTRDVLVDGGIINNLPVDVMEAQRVGKIIAIDVGGGGEKQDKPSPFYIPEAVTGFQALLSRLMPWRKPRIKAPSMVGMLFRVMMLNPADKQVQDRLLADVYLLPDVSRVGIFDTNQSEAIAQIGYEYALPILQAAQKAWSS